MALHDIKLTHYSNEPVTSLYCIPHQPEPKPYGYFQKPEGLWVSVDADWGWKEWCEAEDFSPHRLAVVHDVVLKDDAKILLIENLRQLNSFAVAHTLSFPNDGISPRFTIDWPTVAKKYQGIIIARYIDSIRLDIDHSWYYRWDCASGCIWDTTCIKSIDVRVPNVLQISHVG